MPKFSARWSRYFGLAGSLAPLLGVALFLAAVIIAGKLARNSIADHERYRFPFNRIECAAPPGMNRPDFLDEVQYLASLPDALNVLDDDLPARLAQAFAKHPRVAKVEAVEVRSADQVRVRLVFRSAKP